MVTIRAALWVSHGESKKQKPECHLRASWLSAAWSWDKSCPGIAEETLFLLQEEPQNLRAGPAWLISYSSEVIQTHEYTVWTASGTQTISHLERDVDKPMTSLVNNTLQKFGGSNGGCKTSA